MNMKKILCVLLFLCSTPLVFSQDFTYSTNISNLWGDWKTAYYARLHGKYDDLIVTSNSYDHPSEYTARIKLKNFKKEEDKKERKRRIQANEWYVYEGTITFKSDGEVDLLHLVKMFPNYGRYHSSSETEKTYKATIKIAPYEKSPKTYNIFFEDYGIAISINK